MVVVKSIARKPPQFIENYDLEEHQIGYVTNKREKENNAD
jgi:hypothetical protein